jgi:acyl-CoA synthetase (AMP-forming)/AMP-acid ligase II
MKGLMAERPLLISSILTHAETVFGDVEIVSRSGGPSPFRYTYAGLARRSRQLAKALTEHGVQPGDRLATLAWNTHRHLEIYFGGSGMGAVVHTCNPRLHLDQLAYILNHAGDKILFFDLSFLPLVEQVAPHCSTVKTFVVLCSKEEMPAEHELPNLLCYEEKLALRDDVFGWPEFDERQASSLCYTSGTTGNPKGVLYSHRSTVLHAWAMSLPDSLSLSASDCVLPVVPMFHVNAWGIPYAAALNGTKLVLPGARLDGASLFELMETEEVTCSAGVPTIWIQLAQYMESGKLRPSTMRRSLVGGSAVPKALIRKYAELFQVEIRHAWGMTETSPLGTQGALAAKHLGLPAENQYEVRAKQGRPAFGIEVRVMAPDGSEVPRDGATPGEITVRGHWVRSAYFGDDSAPNSEAWFATGDIATQDSDGYLRITDRAKDVIKSGGEWISSIDLENAAMEHPAVLMAAVIGIPHERWDERPLMYAVRKPGRSVETSDLVEFLAGRVTKWWLPEDVVWVDALPLGATGKVLKSALRESYQSNAATAAILQESI